MGTVPLRVASNSRGHFNPFTRSHLTSEDKGLQSAIIWTQENRVSSDNEYVDSKLIGLPKDSKELEGLWVKVDGGKHGEHKLKGIFAYKPFDDQFVAGDVLTTGDGPYYIAAADFNGDGRVDQFRRFNE